MGRCVYVAALSGPQAPELGRLYRDPNAIGRPIVAAHEAFQLLLPWLRETFGGLQRRSLLFPHCDRRGQTADLAGASSRNQVICLYVPLTRSLLYARHDAKMGPLQEREASTAPSHVRHAKAADNTLIQDGFILDPGKDLYIPGGPAAPSCPCQGNSGPG